MTDSSWVPGSRVEAYVPRLQRPLLASARLERCCPRLRLASVHSIFFGGDALIKQAWEAGFGGEEADVAVFRFTTGIPGFDDAQIPRVVGAAGAALLAANHFLGAGAPSPAQARRSVERNALHLKVATRQ